MSAAQVYKGRKRCDMIAIKIANSFIRLVASKEFVDALSDISRRGIKSLSEDYAAELRREKGKPHA